MRNSQGVKYGGAYGDFVLCLRHTPLCGQGKTIAGAVFVACMELQKIRKIFSEGNSEKYIFAVFFHEGSILQNSLRPLSLFRRKLLDDSVTICDIFLFVCFKLREKQGACTRKECGKKRGC